MKMTMRPAQAADIMNVAPSDCQYDKAKVVEVATTKATRVHCVHSEVKALCVVGKDVR